VGFPGPIRYFWQSLGSLYYDVFTIATRVNAPWAVSLIPWSLAFLWMISIILLDEDFASRARDLSFHPFELIGLPVITGITMLSAAPATAALYHAVMKLDNFESVGWNSFGAAFKRYFFVAWRLAIVDFCILYVLLLAMLFYWNQGNNVFQVLAVMVLYPIIFWLMIQPYLFPLMVALDLNVRDTLRNAAVLALGNFGASVSLLLITAISIVLGFFLNVLAYLLGPAVVAMVGVRVVRDLLKQYQ